MNFEFSLLDEEGKLIEFKTGEDKISAINFTIQIINQNSKSKKTIYTAQNKHTQKNQISQILNDLKSSIKDLYLSNKKKDKTINNQSALIDKIRREYLELYKENQNLKLTIQNYERYYND